MNKAALFAKLDHLLECADWLADQRGSARVAARGLEPYVGHKDGCKIYVWNARFLPCSCGLAEALDAFEKAVP